ncbi:MAG: hypothetical protein AUJ48_02255 [Deltaproteobacteria bacterium CG1_02_45_11]|nr:MAG: hypothetical protein AUJ48_02255 [Deltaproteobacteria bacterium CG1_02_45_11]
MRDIIAVTVKKNPVKYCLFAICILLLTGFEVWAHFSLLPAHKWNIINLKKIDVADPGDFSLAVFGDNRNSKYVFENLLRLIDHDTDIAFAVSLGDMVQKGEKERYRWFLQQVENNLSIPLLTAIGNHERQGDDYGLYHDIFGPLYYSFKIGNNCFFVLDNADGKWLDRKQELWLANELEKSRNCDTRIVFMHMPLYDPRMGRDPHCLGKQASENLIRLFLKYHVTHIFVSHIHGYFQGRWKGIPYTITGGAGAGLAGSNPDHYFFHFLKVHIKNGNLDVEVKQVPSSYEWLGRSGYRAWTSMYSFFRFHGIQALLLLVAAGLVMAIYLRE